MSETLVIDSLDAEGRGIARRDGKVVFVEGALPYERVRAATTKRKPSYELARIEAIERESFMRVTPPCAHFGVCGGCALQHVEPSAQIASKQRILEDALARIGQVTPEAMLPPLRGPDWGYRARARLAARLVPKKGGMLVGFHERHSSYVADMRDCLTLPRHVARLLVPLRALLQSLSIAQRVPQIEVAVGDAVTVLVLRHLEPLSAADEAALRAFADEQRIQWWLQAKGPDSAQPFYPLDAPPLAYALPEFGVTLRFKPTEFTQVNPAINRALVSRALAMLDPRPGERIADLFCGLGNFTLPIATRGASVLGVEGSAPLVARARDNARDNGLGERTQFAVANLFEPAEVAELCAQPYDKLLIDPPRDGAIEVVKAIADQAPRRIVYVSCNPATLARDAGVLVHANSYRLVSAGVVNMFPHTAHVESIAQFEHTKKNGD